MDEAIPLLSQIVRWKVFIMELVVQDGVDEGNLLVVMELDRYILTRYFAVMA